MWGSMTECQSCLAQQRQERSSINYSKALSLAMTPDRLIIVESGSAFLPARDSGVWRVRGKKRARISRPVIRGPESIPGRRWGSPERDLAQDVALLKICCEGADRRSGHTTWTWRAGQGRVPAAAPLGRTTRGGVLGVCSKQLVMKDRAGWRRVSTARKDEEKRVLQ